MTSTPKSASTTSGTTTPSEIPPQSSTSYLSYPVTHIASSLYRRLTEPSPSRPAPPKNPSHTSLNNQANEIPNGVYTPPNRNASPFQPPPLTPLILSGSTSSPILSRAVAEEIRLLVPPRLQLAETWTLAYSLEQDGVSLGTLYNKCASPRLPRDSSFILVIQDGAGGVRPPLPSFPSQTTSSPFPHPLTRNTHLDLRRLSNRPPPPSLLLLRHRRMFPLALLHPPAPHHPAHSIPAPSPLSFRNGNRSYWSQHHNFFSPQPPTKPHLLPFELQFRFLPLASSEFLKWQ